MSSIQRRNHFSSVRFDVGRSPSRFSSVLTFAISAMAFFLSLRRMTFCRRFPSSPGGRSILTVQYPRPSLNRAPSPLPRCMPLPVYPLVYSLLCWTSLAQSARRRDFPRDLAVFYSQSYVTVSLVMKRSPVRFWQEALIHH